MKATILIYRPDKTEPERQDVTEPPILTYWQNAVGGYIEAVPYFHTIELDGQIRDCIAFCNEEGKLKDPPLPLNQPAMRLWDAALRRWTDGSGKRMAPNGLFQPDGQLSDFLVGPIVVIVGDAAFMAEL